MKTNSFFFLLQKTAKYTHKIIPENFRKGMREKIIENKIKKFHLTNSANLDLYQKGVNLIGSVQAEIGLGESCRLVANQLIKCGYDISIYNVNFKKNLREQDFSFFQYYSDELPYGINIFHVNPCELGQIFMEKPELWKRHYNIAFWLWELEEFPDEWIKFCWLFDEIWTPSIFSGKGVSKKTAIPVKVMPYRIPAPALCNLRRTDIGLPEDKFLYLIMYDSNSTQERKNPLDAIEAYKKAYKPEDEECGIVVKINNAKSDDVLIVSEALKSYKNVYIITKALDKREVNNLIYCVDVFVSLHRAEGFGLVMAEAMALGTPVIATNWSANTEFMSEKGSCLVQYSLVQVGRKTGLYDAGNVWAQPDIKEAAEYMKQLKDDISFYNQKSKQGKKDWQAKLNNEQKNVIWKDAIEFIYR